MRSLDLSRAGPLSLVAFHALDGSRFALQVAAATQLVVDVLDDGNISFGSMAIRTLFHRIDPRVVTGKTIDPELVLVFGMGKDNLPHFGGQ